MVRSWEVEWYPGLLLSRRCRLRERWVSLLASMGFVDDPAIFVFALSCIVELQWNSEGRQAYCECEDGHEDSDYVDSDSEDAERVSRAPRFGIGVAKSVLASVRSLVTESARAHDDDCKNSCYSS